MARVDRMPFTPSAEYSTQDKEVAMTWDGSDVPTGFFDQYTMADGPDSVIIRGEGDDDYSQFGPTDLVGVPPPTSIESAPPSLHDQDVAQPGSYPRSMATGHPPRQQAQQYAHHLGVQSHSPHKPHGAFSISNPELLRLDGLSMRSPRVVVPPSVTSSTPSSPRLQPETKKAGRFESVYSTIRKATNLRSRPRASRANSNMATADTMRATKPKNLGVPASQPPASHPLTGPVAATIAQGDPSAMAFVNGYIDDPFGMTDLSGLPAANHTLSHGVTAPDGNVAQQTNWLYNDAFAHHGANPQGGGGGDMQWNPAFAPVDTKQEGGAGGAEWWEALPPRDQPFMDDASAFNTNARNATFNLVMAQLERSGVDYDFALATGLLPAELAHGGGDGGGGGGSIHMPQPRQPPPATLLNNEFALDGQAYHPHAGGGPSRQQQHQQQQQHRQAQPGHLDRSTTAPIGASAPGAPTYRRPQPRAPSTGARYHHAGSLTSPRKVRDRSTSSSSPSPTQSAARSSRATSRGGGGGRQQRRSASNHAGPSSTSSLSSTASNSSSASSAPPPKLAPPHAIRKQKSWSHNRRTSSTAMAMSAMASKSRVPSSSSSKSEPQQQQQQQQQFHPPATPDRRRASEGGSGAGIGFVNFTPSDHDFLMTGVAPSGSSKTKARREREAQDRQRRLNEAVMKAVAASGGDVAGLRELTWGV